MIVVELIMLVVGPTCYSGGGCVGVIMLEAGPICDSDGGLCWCYFVSGWSYL